MKVYLSIENDELYFWGGGLLKGGNKNGFQFFFKILYIILMQVPQEFLSYISNLKNIPGEMAHAALDKIRGFYSEVGDPQILTFLFYKMTQEIMKSKSAIGESTSWLFDQCIYDIIERSIRSQFEVGSQALRWIFDINMEYYKHNNLDTSLKNPLGLNRKLNYYEPEIGEEVDVVKPYITSTSYCAWTRGTLLNKDNKKYTVKYHNTQAPSITKDIPFFDKLGTRTTDYDWRNNLEFGSLVDGFNKVWYPSTVIEVGFENGAKRVRVSFRRFSQAGHKIDSDGNRYDGLGPNEDDWIDILSYRIQKPNKMARQLCEFSHICEQLIIDDTYDLLFEKQYEQKPFFAIMRNTYTRSLSFLHYYQHFCLKGGNEMFLQILKKPDAHIDNITNIMIVLGNTSFLVPRMGVNRYLPQILMSSMEYLKENSKSFNLMKLQIIFYLIESISKRIYSITTKHNMLNEIRKFISVQFVKHNLEKQMIALKYLYDLTVRPTKPYSHQEKQSLHQFLTSNNIFYKFIQNNVHEQILTRSADVLRYMIDNKIIGWTEIEYIWNIIPHSDIRGRVVVQKLIGDISKDFTFEFTSRIIDNILNVKETDLTIDKLNLLRVLKDRELTTQYKVKILNYLWECLTIKSTNIKQNVEEEMQNVFRGFITTIKDSAIKLEVLKAILKRLQEINTVKNQMYLFKEFILTYPYRLEANEIQEENAAPKIIADVLEYLKSNNIYLTLLKLLSLVKTKEKIESILEFVQFLFEKDKDDISQTVKAIYDILGPSDIFLLWAKSLTSRALSFFIEMYQNPTNMSQFQKMSSQGFESIKSVLLDINVSVGNIKVLRKRKTVLPVQGPLMPHANSVSTSTQNYSLLPDKNKQKDQYLTFVYVLKSPFQCIGLTFLLQLCQYVQAYIYSQAIKLIIQFIVNLDESIINKASIFRQEFLSMIFKHIGEIVAEKKQFSSVKLQMEIYINLIQELFSETEKDGVTVKPHFSTVQGEIIRLKIQNNIQGNDLHRKQPLLIEVNETIIFWEFKCKLAEIYQISPSKVDIVKYINPLDDANNGKSLSDLHFFNEQGIKIQKKQAKQIPRQQLINGFALSQRFKVIIQKWFNAYKNNQGILGLQELKRLSLQNWKGSIMKDQARLQQMLNKYDVQKKGGVDQSQFKEFFWKKAVENSTLVWRILNLSGYLNTLRHKQQPQIIVEEAQQPRKILSTRAVYDIIFQILSNDSFQPIHINFYRLLVMLQTDHQFCHIAKSNIKGFLQNQKCIHKLSYGLQTLISQLQTNLPFYEEFYQHKGLQEITNKLQNFFQDNQKSIYAFQTSLKTIVIPNLLKIVNLYVYPFASTHRLVRFAKKVKINHLDVTEITKKMQNQQNYAQENELKRNILLANPNQINVQQLYNLSLKILLNLNKHFTAEYLIKISHETIRLFAYLSFIYPGFKPQDLFGCTNSGSLNIRRSSQALIYLYLIDRQSQSFNILQQLAAGFPTDIKNFSSTSFELFKFILQKTIDLKTANEEAENIFFTKLSVDLLTIFLKNSCELRQSFMPSKIIQGILQNLLIIIQKRPTICRLLRHYKEELIQSLFFYHAKEKLQLITITPQMLLNSTQPQIFPNYVKCKSELTRKLLMEVIYQLYKECGQGKEEFFGRYIMPVLSQLPENTKKSGSKSMHVGLNNLGSTCYMNSMLQVLNSIDAFRNVIMMANIDAPLIHQLKSLFSYLFFSQRLDYIPKDLLSSFKPPINPAIQQDTTQFLNFLFDQIEPLLKNSPYKNLLEELFKGSQVAQMICHSCGAKRERLETFFSYSVEIEGKYDLHTALDGMHAGELISDCLCETCGNRSDTTKRNVLNEVPNIFFVHLKRIVFNYDIFMNTKIHTRLFFPEELNFQPFTKQGLELRESLGVQYMKSLKDNEQKTKQFQKLALHGKTKQYYKLNLKGIIVHSGTPDVGHYYAILKKNGSWVKFDDSRVSCFPMSFFEDECYGGTWVADEWGGSASSKNAYVLIYEKDFKKDIEIGQIEDGKVVKKLVPQKEIKTFNTVQWYKQVWLDNHSLMIEQHLTSQNYTKDFLNFICKMLQLAPSPATVDTISEIFVKISALSGQVGNLLEIFNKNTHLINATTLEKYVLSDPKRTFGLLFHQQQKVRDFASSYLQRVLMVCYEKEHQVREKVVRFMQEYLQALQGEVAKNWLRIDGYFKMFQKIVQSSVAFPQLYAMFVSIDLIAYLIDFVLQKQSPLNIYQKKYSLGTKANPVAFTSALNIILFLLKRSFGFIGNNYEVPQIDPNYLFHLSDNAVSCLSSMAFYQKMIKENQNPQAISSIIQRLSILNQPFSHAISRVLLKIFNENTDVADECDTVMLCISRFLTIRDDFWTSRAEFVLGYGSCYVYEKNVMVSLDEEKYIYPSTLQNVFPLQSLLAYIHMNRLRVPLTVLNMIKTVLQVTSCSQQAMRYIAKQPSPTYIHLRYIDWLRPYVNQVMNHVPLTDKKKETTVSKISICNLYLDDLNKFIQNRNTPMFVQVIGQIGEKVNTQFFSDPLNQVEINIYRVPVFAMESLPNGKGNSSVDHVLENGRLQTQATETSNILKLFKQSNKPLAIKAKNVEEHQDKQIISLFDEQPNPKKEAQVQPVTQPPKPVQIMKEELKAPLEPIEEIIPVDINLDNIKEQEDYLNCLEIQNNTDSNKLVILNIATQNANLPKCLRIMASKNKEEFWYHKINPYEPLGKIEFSLTVAQYIQANPKPFFRLYGNPFPQKPQPIQVEQPKQQGKEEQKMQQQVSKENEGNNNNQDFMQSDQISCPICTFFNPPTNIDCEVCGSSLQQA